MRRSRRIRRSCWRIGRRWGVDEGRFDGGRNAGDLIGRGWGVRGQEAVCEGGVGRGQREETDVVIYVKVGSRLAGI